MRPWGLVCLCGMGLLGGGACSARPLLAISLTSPSQTYVMAYPRIDVTRADGSLVKDVDKLDGGDMTSLLLLSDSMPLQIGVYLPAGTEGTVNVSATMVAMTGSCTLSGAAPDPVTVHGGDRTNVSIMLDKTGNCAPPAGDAGSPTGDAKSEAHEAGPLDGVDADAENHVLDCFDYCQQYNMSCAAWISDPIACMAACETAHWPVGTQDAATGENTFGCRERHLRASADASLDCSECYAASPESPGICGPPLDASARGACPP
jgi:hypothetical protein